MPDIIFKTLEEIPEGLREHAESKDGAFVLDAVPGKKLKEFRDNNIAIVKERDTHKNENATWRSKVGEDPEKVVLELTELRGIKQKVEDGKLQGTDKIEAMVATRAKTIEDGYKTQIAERDQKLTVIQARNVDLALKWKRSVLRQEITAVALEGDSGANPAALTDILACAEGDFAIQDNGQLVRMNGEAVVYGADGVTAQSPKEWLAGLLKSKTYFQKPSTGGGASGGRGTGNFGLSDADFQKLPPAERMAIARKHQSQQR
jgi:hypothetical protein